MAAASYGRRLLPNSLLCRQRMAKPPQCSKSAQTSHLLTPERLSFGGSFFSQEWQLVRLCFRLQAWAALLSEEKRSLACEIKVRAPAEVVGAHLRFITRTGTWERLLLDLHEILESAVREREQAVGLLSAQFSETPGAPRHALRTPCEP